MVTLKLATIVLMVAWPTDRADVGGEVHVGARARPDGTLKVMAYGGRVNVQGWGRDSIDVIGRFDERVASIEFLVDGAAGRLRVLPTEAGAAPLGELDILVPYGTFVAVRAGEAVVIMDRVEGGSDVVTETGDITVRGGGTRSVYAESAGGAIRVEAGTKILRAKSVEGSVFVPRALGFIEIQTVSGGVTLAGNDVSQGRVSTVSGDIRFEGGFDRTGIGFTFETHSGTIALALNASVDADLELHSLHGAVDNAFNATKLGRGGAPVNATSFKGRIRVTRR